MKFTSYLRFLRKVLLISFYRNFNLGFQMPYKYIFLVTNKCNSRCRTCNIWKIYKKNPEKIREELTLSEYKKIFNKIKNKVLWVNFSGGEPFLRHDIDELSILAIRYFKRMSILNIPTNGSQPHVIKKKVLTILKNLNESTEFFITLSLDGIGKKHDEIRGIKGSYKNVIKTYDYLKELEDEFPNFFVGYQFTISKFNINDIGIVVKFLRNTSLPIFAFSHENKYFNNLNSNVDLRKLDHEILLEKVRFISRAYKISVFKDLIPKIYLKLAENFYKNPEKLVLPCYSSFSTITVDPYGNVLPCSYFQNNIGNLRNLNYDLEQILNGNRIKKIRKIIKMEKCPVCWANCEAYPSVLQNFLLVFKKLLLFK